MPRTSEKPLGEFDRSGSKLVINRSTLRRLVQAEKEGPAMFLTQKTWVDCPDTQVATECMDCCPTSSPPC